jgi:2,3-diketo-5-methylthio-1-phosphopentane phosphatase
MTPADVLIFCDFDGTVARRDVGYHIFHHFSGGRTEELIPDWKAGKISSREILEREAAMVTVTPEEVYRFLDGFDLSPGFVEFVEMCRKNSTAPILLSEGMGFYISYLLERHGVSGIDVISNEGKLTGKTIEISFPHTNTNCTRCGSCKGERMAEYKARRSGQFTTVFVGDGMSDVCAVCEADIVFAKKDFERYCQAHKIAYNSFSSFFDVAERLVGLGLLKR